MTPPSPYRGGGGSPASTQGRQLFRAQPYNLLLYGRDQCHTSGYENLLPFKGLFTLTYMIFRQEFSLGEVGIWCLGGGGVGNPPGLYDLYRFCNISKL